MSYYNATWSFIGGYVLVQGQGASVVLTPEQAERLAQDITQARQSEPEYLPQPCASNNGQLERMRQADARRHFDVI